MATITPHTTRATGTVLTASLYNTDHQNHVTNVTAVNNELGTLSTTVSADIAALQTDVDNAAGDVSTLAVGAISHYILVPGNQDYMFTIKIPFAGTINETVTRCTSGTCTATFKINTTALGGTPNAVSTTEQTQAQASNNTFAIGDDLVVTVSANAACLNFTFTVKYTRTL